MKKLACILFSFIFLVCAVSCSSQNPNTKPQNPDTSENHSKPQLLDTPKVSYENGMITWDVVENADKYEIEVNGKIEITYNAEYPIDVTSSPIEYKVRVKAISESPLYLNSSFSTLFSFKTYRLSPITFGKVLYTPSSPIEEIRHIAQLPVLKNGADYYTVYINGEYSQTSNNDILTLYSSEFVVGKNTLDIYAYTNYEYDIDGIKSSLTVYVNAPYDDVWLEEGEIKYSFNGEEMTYDTSAFPIGESYHSFYNNSYPAEKADIYFSSEGPIIHFYKINAPQISSCTYTETVLYKRGQVFIALKNYIPNIPENYYMVGYDYDTVEVTIYDNFGIVDTLSKSVVPGQPYVECTFDFDILHFTDFITHVSVRLKKAGYLTSNPTIYKFNRN